MTRPFLAWPDKRLRQVAEPIDAVTDETRALWDQMVEIMEAMPGYGLAATQIGVMQRVAVVDCSDERGRVIRLANPEILASSDETFVYEEASPNLPGVSAKVKRPARVTVSFLDAAGDRVKQDFEDVWATSVQHQIDHLNGRMYFDNLSRTKREMLLKRAQKK
ncbi:MAG: peptide deformylase [Pseudomonadota bacterium]